MERAMGLDEVIRMVDELDKARTTVIVPDDLSQDKINLMESMGFKVIRSRFAKREAFVIPPQKDDLIL